MMKTTLQLLTLLVLAFTSQANETATAQETQAIQELKLAVSATNPLEYDLKELHATTGSPIKIIFNNNATIPLDHNLLIIQPGALEAVQNAAMAMMANYADALEAGFVPKLESVLHASSLLKQNQTEVLEFSLEEAGDYPYVCTFPGHTTTMVGVLKVTAAE